MHQALARSLVARYTRDRAKSYFFFISPAKIKNWIGIVRLRALSVRATRATDSYREEDEEEDEGAKISFKID